MKKIIEDKGINFVATDLTVMASKREFVLDFIKHFPKKLADNDNLIFREHCTICIDVRDFPNMISAMQKTIEDYQKTYMKLQKGKSKKLTYEKKTEEKEVSYLG
jgi:CRISPR/Cas system type I-B associated protein Csh2 (Cas7 group RAMP superfamily)